MEEAGRLQFALQMAVKTVQHRLVGDRRALAEGGRRAIGLGRPPFIGVDRHRLGQVERAEPRVDGDGDDRLAEGDVLGFQPRPFAAEQQPGVQPLRRRGVQLHGRLARSDDRQHDFAGPRGGGVEPVQVGDGVLDPVEHTRPLQRPVRAGSRGPGPVLGPAVARPHHAQVLEPEIGHDAGDRADVLGKLRLVEDDAGFREHGLFHARVLPCSPKCSNRL